MAIGIGDVVRLRNGGPPMTVIRGIINLETCEVDAKCCWFTRDRQVQTAVFPKSALEIVISPTKPRGT